MMKDLIMNSINYLRFIAMILALCFLFFLPVSQGVYFYFDPPVRIQDYAAYHRDYPKFGSSSDSTIALFWSEGDLVEHRTKILCCHSDDLGRSWNYPVEPGSFLPFSLYDTFACGYSDENLIVLLFYPRGDYFHLYSLVSYDFGRTWLPAYSQVDDYHNSSIAYKAVAAGPDRLLAVWREREGLYSSYSDDGGLSWSSPNVRVDDFSEFTMRGHLTVYGCSDGTFIAAWSDGRYDGDTDVWCAVSEDGGESWSENIQVNGDFSGAQQIPDIAQGPDGLIYLAYKNVINFGQKTIHVAVSNDNGYHWTDSGNRINAEICSTGSPDIECCNDGLIVVTWMDYRYLEWTKGFISCSNDGGVTWTDNQAVGPDINISKTFITALPDNDIVIMYGKNNDYCYSIHGRREPGTPLPPYTPRPTWTHRPTWTPSPTPTTEPSPTDTPTDTPTSLPTEPATPTSIPSATAEPTPYCPSLEPHLRLNKSNFSAGDDFLLECYFCNPGQDRLVDHYIILDIHGQYWFWPP